MRSFLTAAVWISICTAANAAVVIEFSPATDPLKPVQSVFDPASLNVTVAETATRVVVELGLLAVGDISEVYLNLSVADPLVSEIGQSTTATAFVPGPGGALVPYTAGPVITKSATFVSGINSGQGNSMGGIFDLAFQIGEAGLRGGSDDIRKAVLSMPKTVLVAGLTHNLTAEDVTYIAVHVQSVGPTRSISSRNYYVPGTPVGDVPEPGTYALVGGALLALVSRRYLLG